MCYAVTPFAGVWIEIPTFPRRIRISMVTPFAGVWIEIHHISQYRQVVYRSLPSRECGLKSQKVQEGVQAIGHSLRGSVD